MKSLLSWAKWWVLEYSKKHLNLDIEDAKNPVSIQMIKLFSGIIATVMVI